MTSPEPGDVLDMSVIASLRELGGGDSSLLCELIDLFLADAPKHVATIEAALESGDASELERAAHSLKSSCANIGALSMSTLCFDLEVMGRENAIDGRPELLTEVRDRFTSVRAALTALKS